MNASPHPLLKRRVCADWVVTVSYVIGFILTVWLLLDAEITMIVAHRQWEIHQETALQIALMCWTPLVAATLVALHFLRRPSKNDKGSFGATNEPNQALE